MRVSRRLQAAALAVSCALASIAACDGHDAPISVPYLIVQVATAQPTATNLGVVVVVQSSPGTLRMRSVGGTIRFTTSEAPQLVACIPAPGSLLYLTVTPNAAQALLYVDLIDPSAPSDANSAPDATLAEICPGTAALSRVVPIAQPPTNLAADGGGGSDQEAPSIDGGLEGSPDSSSESEPRDAALDGIAEAVSISDVSVDGAADATGE